jgi:signal recognition particle receptor subunit beta
MEVIRLAVTGTVGAGKSTFIRSISDVEVIDTERVCTDEAASLKQKTTVALDFGRLSFSPDMIVHLYGTPGQFRFDFMWDILIHKVDAYIFLVPAHRPSDFSQARNILTYMNERVQIPLIIGLTHTDRPGSSSEENIAIALGFVDEKTRPPIVKVNATQKASVQQAISLLMHYFQ